MSNWEDAFWRLLKWMEDDPDRRWVVIRADTWELFWLALYIDHHVVNSARGFELPDVVSEVMQGFI